LENNLSDYPHRARKHRRQHDDATAFALVIIHARTLDNVDGEPWPPDGGDYWGMVARDRGYTIWRRIILRTMHSAAVALGDGLSYRISAARPNER
jgi:hypothetical protein